VSARSALTRRMLDPRLVPRRSVATIGLTVLIAITAAGALAGDPVVGFLVGAALAVAIAWTSFYVMREQREARDEVRELWGLAGVMVDGTPWPAPGGWAISASALRCLLLEMNARACRTVVELGPGTSSIVLGRAKPDLQIAGLEHDVRFVNSLAGTLREHRLGTYQLIHAPLVPQRIAGREVPWYDSAAVARLPEKIDVLIVDGPPNGRGVGGRSPAWPVLRTRMAPGGLVLVDDTDRPDERRMVDSWVADRGLRVITDGGSFVVLEVC
jgi:Methyltransferase domain